MEIITLNYFREQIAEILDERYGITIDDCLRDERIEASFNEGETAVELVDWVAEKYDLTTADEMSIGHAKLILSTVGIKPDQWPQAK